MNLEVALALRAARGQWLQPDVLARHAGLSLEGLRGALRDLRAAGYRVAVRPGGAMRLLSAPDRLLAEEIRHRLGTRVIGNRVTVCAETTSTNDLAWAALMRDEPGGGCVFAEHQTHGRGRRGRRWVAPPGTSVLMSVGIDQAVDSRSGAALTFAASVAAAEAITASTGLDCAIEWPNDITSRDRKLAGILVESRRLRAGTAARASASPAYVVGVGINCNVPLGALPPDVRMTATSLAEECGGPVDRVLLARHLIQALDEWCGVLIGGGPGEASEGVARVLKRWLELSATVGRRLTVEQHGRRLEGVVVDASPTEGLALRLDHGEVRFVKADSASVIQRSTRV